jgi:hypothetical protein
VKWRTVSVTLVQFAFSMLLLTPASYSENGLPNGWFRAGSRPENYGMSLDRTVLHSGAASAQIKFIGRTNEGFGTLMQLFKADDYRGKRVRMSAWMKTEKADSAQLWMRLDGRSLMLGVDNMNPRRVKGTRDWKKYEIILDVPADTVNIAFGAFGAGRGRAWVDDFAFEAVDKNVRTTNLLSGPQPSSLTNTRPTGVPTQPANLGFEKVKTRFVLTARRTVVRPSKRPELRGYSTGASTGIDVPASQFPASS